MKKNYAIILFIVLTLLIMGCSKDKTPSDTVIVGDDNQTKAPEQKTIDSSNISSNPSTDNNTGTGIVATGNDTNTETKISKGTAVTKNTVSTTNTKTLKELFAGRTLKYTVKYIVNANESSDEITQVFNLPKYVMITKIGNDETRTIFDGTSMITCSSTEGSWQCYKVAANQPKSANTETEVNDGTATTTIIGTCKVAGENGIKYEVTTREGAKSQVCYTSDGILLSISTVDPEYYMVASEISRSIDSSLFVVPAEPQDLSSLLNNIPQ